MIISRIPTLLQTGLVQDFELLFYFNAFSDLGITVISKIEVKTTQNDTYPKFIHSHYSDWHSGYFIAVCEKSK